MVRTALTALAAVVALASTAAAEGRRPVFELADEFQRSIERSTNSANRFQRNYRAARAPHLVQCLWLDEVDGLGYYGQYSNGKWMFFAAGEYNYCYSTYGLR